MVFPVQRGQKQSAQSLPISYSDTPPPTPSVETRQCYRNNTIAVTTVQFRRYVAPRFYVDFIQLPKRAERIRNPDASMVGVWIRPGRRRNDTK